VKTIAGTPGVPGYADDFGLNAKFSYPSGISQDRLGNLYIADRGNHIVRKITPEGRVTTLAGTPSIKGWNDGIGEEAQFLYPECVAVDSNKQEVFVADFGNHAIRKISVKEHLVITVAGSPGKDGSLDGANTIARFTSPNGVAVDNFGNVFVIEYRNHTVRKLFHLFWSINSHHLFPKIIRDQIKILLLLAQRDSRFNPHHPQCLLYMLPKEILFRLFDLLV